MGGRTILFLFKKSFLVILAGAVLVTALLSNVAVSVLAKKAYYPLAGKKVVIDPGHGGVDSGANDSGGFKEKQVNLEVALKLRKILILAGAEVVMTRTRDEDVTRYGDPGKKRYHRDMDGRKKVMNESGADIFISLHVNSCRGANRTRGSFVFFHKQSQEGKVLAECLQGQLNAMVNKYKKEGEHATRGSRSADYFLLRNAGIPAALIEMGFMTHNEERKLLYDDAYQEEIAKAIAAGLRDYFLCLAVETTA